MKERKMKNMMNIFKKKKKKAIRVDYFNKK